MTLYKIRFDKNRYHQSRDMIEWCETHIGHGGWNSRYIDHLPVDYKWDVDTVFGMTTFRFSDPKDFSKFLVKWEWADGNV